MNTLELLTPFDMKGLRLKNRVVMAPMTRSRAKNPKNKVTELIAEYYRQRSTAGLIITEGSQISEQGVPLSMQQADHDGDDPQLQPHSQNASKCNAVYTFHFLLPVHLCRPISTYRLAA